MTTLEDAHTPEQDPALERAVEADADPYATEDEMQPELLSQTVKSAEAFLPEPLYMDTDIYRPKNGYRPSVADLGVADVPAQRRELKGFAESAIEPDEESWSTEPAPRLEQVPNHLSLTYAADPYVDEELWRPELFTRTVKRTGAFLPEPPTRRKERYLYAQRKFWVLNLGILLSLPFLVYTQLGFISTSMRLWVLPGLGAKS
jgi:hypothetical protein